MTMGAEAVVYRDDGRIRKEREPKQYRHPDLDRRLREDRTDREARLLRKARQAGVRVPDVEVDDGTTLVMDRIDGTLLRAVFEEEQWTWQRLGADIARLHGRDIIHGDLTTSNMIVAGDDLYFIDFGLGTFSDRTEDRATDLHLLQEVLVSTHTAVAEEAMRTVLEAYQEQAEDADEVVERFESVAGRGRYT